MKLISDEAGTVQWVAPTQERETSKQQIAVLDQIVPGLTIFTSLVGFVLGIFMIPSMKMEFWVLPGFIVLSVVMQLLFLDVYRQHKVFEWRGAALAVLAFLVLYLYRLLPEYFAFGQINAIFHRSLVAAVAFLLLGPPAMSLGIYYFFGARPSAQDSAVYPLLFAPVVLALGLYLIMLFKIIQLGLANFDWEVLTQPFALHGIFFRTFIAEDWPTWDVKVLERSGMLNHLLGTGILIFLTSLISLPVGIGTGIYLSENGETRFVSIVRFATTSLRAISLLILAFFAISLANFGKSTFLAPLFVGTFNQLGEERLSNGGSFLLAGLVISLVIIPVIARATEEGCRSTPPELREGSLALGATEDLTLRRIILPWALPNIVTAWLLGCAETAGAVAVLLYIAGTGEFGVGLNRQVTSLAYYIFNSYFFTDLARGGLMRPYVYMAAMLLLMITLGLGVAALLSKRWFVRRYRGG